MRGDTFITFRGEADVAIEYDVDFSGPGSGVGVQWWFAEKRPDGEAEPTPDEEEAIVEAAIASADGRARDLIDD